MAVITPSMDVNSLRYYVPSNEASTSAVLAAPSNVDAAVDILFPVTRLANSINFRTRFGNYLKA